jgi:hypothetical protein
MVLLADTHLRLYLGHLHRGDMAVDDLDLVPVRKCFLFGTSIRNQRIGEITPETSSGDVIIPCMPPLASGS